MTSTEITQNYLLVFLGLPGLPPEFCIQLDWPSFHVGALSYTDITDKYNYLTFTGFGLQWLKFQKTIYGGSGSDSLIVFIFNDLTKNYNINTKLSDLNTQG